MTLYPFSASQKDIWTELLAWSNSSHLNIGGFSRLKGKVDPALYQRALDSLTAEEDALRLVPCIDGQQKLLEHYQYDLVIKDFSGEENGERLATKWQQDWMKQPFEIGDVPPIRFALVSAAEDLHYVVIQSLHIAMDGWSLSNTVQKLGQHYTALLNGSKDGIEDSRSYLDFIVESNDYRTSKTFEKDYAYWQEALPVLPEGVFERRYNDINACQVARANIETCDIPRTLIDALKALAAEHKATLFHCFMALLAIYIAKSQGRNDFVIGIPSLNRGGNKYKKSLGMFVGVIPIRILVPDDATPADLVEQISKSLKKAYRHAKYPLSEQFKRLNAIQQGRDRLFDVIFSFEDFVFYTEYGDAEVGATNQTFSGHSRYPLAISVCDFEEFADAEMVLEGNQEYFSAAETGLIGQRILYLGQQLLSDFNAPISELDICTPKEAKSMVNSGLSLAQSERLLTPYFQQILDRSNLNPSATALVWEGGTLSYYDMTKKAEVVAQQLRELGVVQGDSVAIALERGPEVLIAILACGFIGAVFINNDVEIPVSRLQTIIQQGNAKCLLLNDANSSRFVDVSVPVIDVDIERLSKRAYIEDFEVAASGPDAVAYVLFTSGTTGTPKGVAVSHKALSLRLGWIAETWNVTSSDRSLQSTQVNFDPALIELLVPLLRGGSVAFPAPGRLLPEVLPEWMVKYAATMIAFVPSTLTRFLDGIKEPEKLKLRICCCGGEILSTEIAQRFVSQTGATLFNVYGPTEATIFASSWQVREQDKRYRSLPIGEPLANTQIFILDKNNKLLPYGVVGEVFLAGDTLSDGYVNNEERNVSHFIEAPFTEQTRLYKTGDLGWLDTDGVLHFSGRNDRQIKLRGYRIELNEIENTLLNQHGVRSAAVKVVGQGSKAQIQAWIVSESSFQLDRLRTKLARILPDYMLPARYNLLEEMPYTTNEKIDYEALSPTGFVSNHSESREPVGRFERQILAIWRDTLSQPNLTVMDNFFEFGGDSLSAVTTLNQVEQMLGKRLSLYQLVENPTVSSFADCIETALNLPKLMVSLGDTTRNVSMYICASGNGDMLRFQALAKAMHGICDLHMLQPPGNQTDIDIYELASLYANKIIERNETQVYIAGFSVGGLAALETAKLLSSSQVKVNELLIVDTILLKMPDIGLLLWRKLGAWLLKSGDRGRKLLSNKIVNTVTDRGLYMQVKAMKNYQLSEYQGKASLLKSSAYRYIQRLLVGGWRKVIASDLREYQIETSHSRFFEPGNVERLAEKLTARIKQNSDTEK